MAGGVDSIHLDVMDGHFVDNITLGPVVVEALRPHAVLPFHSHLMISHPLAYVDAFAAAGSDIVVFHVEADDEPERGDRRDPAQRPSARHRAQPRHAGRDRSCRTSTRSSCCWS